MLCFACDAHFQNNLELLKHIRRVHAHLPKFRCCEINCKRSFGPLNSFLKHRKDYHSGNNIQVICNDDIHQIETENEHHNNNLELSAPVIELNTSTPNSINEELPQYKNLLEPSVQLLAKLHSYPDIPQSRVVEIAQDFTNFFTNQIESFEDCMSVFQQELSIESNNKMNSELLKLRSTFSKFGSSKYLQLKAFENFGTYIPPTQVVLGQRDDYRRKKKKDGRYVLELCHVKLTSEFIPIRYVFQKFFEIPNIFKETIAYIQSLLEIRSTVVTNFIQGKFWQKKIESFGEKIVFPLFLYNDDFENNNPLGSHAGIAKCSAVYLSIPCLPPKYVSKLSNIFLFVLFNSLERKLLKNRIIFKEVLQELVFLRDEGILIKVDGVETQIFFELGLILGDNLGLHSLLGFVESFVANYPCRFCLTHFKDFRKYFNEEDVTLRNKLNYSEHVNKKDVKSTGIVEECIFHELNDNKRNKETYHVTINKSVDVMHDVFEGICQYDLAKIFDEFINKKKFFSISQLQERINGFSYNSWENKPPDINEKSLKSKLKMSSSEMITLVRNLTLLIGDFIPTDDVHWKLFLKLRKIVDIIMSDSYVPNTHIYLKGLIQEYLEELENLFLGSIKPKHHYFMHYSDIMDLMGPLWKISSMRFESRHQEGKKAARAAICRINVCHTIAIKSQLKLNYRLISQISDGESIWNFGVSTKKDFSKLPDYTRFSHFFTNSSHGEELSWISIFGKKIYPHNVIIEYNNEYDEPTLYIIKHLLTQNSDVIILVNKCESFLYDDHFLTYELFYNDIIWHCLQKNVLQNSFIGRLCELGNRKFISTYTF